MPDLSDAMALTNAGCLYSLAPDLSHQQIAYEVGNRGINVNCVCPSQTLTDMLEESMTATELKELASSVPLKRLANIDDQVYPIMFLCSEEASYITGAVLDVNGGQL